MPFRSINPFNGTTIFETDVWTAQEVRHALGLARNSSSHWQRTLLVERLALVSTLANKLLEEKEGLASLVTAEMGKPIVESRAEIEKCARLCAYYADQAESFLASVKVTSKQGRAILRYAPMGAVLLVMPWNYPFWQVFRAAIPALVGGNVVLLKHAGNVQHCAARIGQLFSDSLFPKGVFQNLPIQSSLVAEIIADPLVQAISVTGSTPTGKAVAAVAGQNLKKCVLELGGSDPYLILEDADLDLAAKTCAAARLLNCGQSCISAKRLIVARTVLEPFLERLADEFAGYAPADPMLETTRLGPLARKDLREEVHAQVTKSVDAGAKLLQGGFLPEGSGYFYPPTILSQVNRTHSVYHEEVFGPAATILTAETIEEMIFIANDTEFGLGAAVFSKNVEEAIRLASTRLQAGSFAINTNVRSDPALPFGGIRQSGYGRELGSWGLHEFQNLQTIQIGTD